MFRMFGLVRMLLQGQGNAGNAACARLHMHPVCRSTASVLAFLQHPMEAKPVPGEPGRVVYDYAGSPTPEDVAFLERQQWPLPEGRSLQDPDFAAAIHTGKHSRNRL